MKMSIRPSSAVLTEKMDLGEVSRKHLEQIETESDVAKNSQSNQFPIADKYQTFQIPRDGRLGRQHNNFKKKNQVHRV